MAFKIGDKVTIYRKVTKRNMKTFNNSWISYMDAFIGTTSEITAISCSGIRLKDMEFGWPPSALKYAR